MYDRLTINNFRVIGNLQYQDWQIAVELLVKVNETWPAQLGVAQMGILFFVF